MGIAEGYCRTAFLWERQGANRLMFERLAGCESVQAGRWRRPWLGLVLVRFETARGRQTMTTFTAHALARALDMALEPDELRELVMNPEQRYWSRKYNCWTYQRGRLAAGVAEESGERVVLTVLWRTADAWSHDARRAPLPEGRYEPGR